jgi:hypothetical protein
MSTDIMETLRLLWDVDPGRATLIARMNRADLPTDLLQRVAARDAMVREQTARLREARTIHDRVNTGMAILGGSVQAAMSTAFTPVGLDAGRQMFELVIGLAALDLPPLPDPGGAHEAAMEACLRGTITGAQFYAAILPAEHRDVAGQLQSVMSVLEQQLGPEMRPVTRLLEALPRVIAALSLPAARLPTVFGPG